MTNGSIKPFLSNSNLSDKKCSCNTKFILICTVFGIFAIFNAFFAVKNHLELNELKSEIDEMRTVFLEIKKNSYLDLIKDVNNFEKAYKATDLTDDENNDDALMKGINDDDYSSDSIYDDDDDDDKNAFDGSGDYLNDEYYKDPYPEDLEDLPENSRRYSRSIAPRNSVPVVEESYALKRNQTKTSVDNYVADLLLNKNNNDPRLKYDWNEKGQLQWRPRRIPHRRRSEKMQAPIHHAVVYHATFAPFTAEAKSTTHKRPEMHSRRSRVMQTNEDKSKAFRQVIKKSEYEKMKGIFNPQGDLVEMKSPPPEIVFNKKPVGHLMHKSMDGKATNRQGHRARDIAAHFTAYSPREDRDGHFEHPGGAYKHFEASAWTNRHSMTRFFTLQNGTVTVLEPGIYFIYAQIFFNGEHDHNGFYIDHNNKPLFHCTVTTHSSYSVIKPNTCYTSGITHIQARDTIRLVSLGNNRYILSEPTKSFFGLYKLGSMAASGN